MKQLIKEYCTPDNLEYEKLGLHHNWLHDCYPFITTSQGIVYGDEGDKHSDMTYRVIAQIVDCDEDDVINVKNEEYDYYPSGKESDGCELRNIIYHFRDKNEGRIIWIDLYYQDGARGDFSCLYEPNAIRKELLLYGVHEEILDELVNDIMNQKYTSEVYSGLWLDIDEEPHGGSNEPYFAIDGEEVSEDLINEILYYLNDGKTDLADYTYDYGRIWVEIGKNYESYISLWLNQRIDWDREMDNGKIEDEDKSYALRNNTFDVFDANYDTLDNGSHVPSSLSDDTIESCIEVFKHFGCDLENSFIAIGDTVLPVLKVHNKEEQFTINDDDIKKSEEERAIHLLPPDQKRETDQIKGFISDRNAKWNKKLMGHDLEGNETEVMPMAKYNFYKRYGLGDSRQIQGNLVENETQYHPEEQDEYKIGFDGLGNADDFGHVMTESRNVIDFDEVDGIRFETYCDEDEYIDYLNEEGLEDSEEIKNKWIDENCSFSIYFYDRNYEYIGSSDQNYLCDLKDYYTFDNIPDEYIDIILEEYNRKPNPYDGDYRIDNIQFELYSESDDIYSAAKHLFNTTSEYFHGAHGFVLRDGTIVLMDGDHNEITQLKGIEDKWEFVEMGNPSILNNNLRVGGTLTYEQEQIIGKMIRSYSDEELYVSFLKGPKGDQSCKYVYPDYRKVFADIDRYYEEGMIPLGENTKPKKIYIPENKLCLIKEGISKILYHFTTLDGLIMILNDNALKGDYLDKISFTRNYNSTIGYPSQHNPHNTHQEDFDRCIVRLTVDGETLGYNYKGEPYNDFGRMRAITRPSVKSLDKLDKMNPQVESEDRVDVSKHNGEIDGIINYIKKIDILFRNVPLDWVDEYVNELDELRELEVNVNVFFDESEFNKKGLVGYSIEEAMYMLRERNLEESKSLIKENVTDIVYHFTDIYAAVQIVKLNYLKTHSEEEQGNYISVTRQRNCNVGFAKEIYADDCDCFVRFQLDGYGLNLNNQITSKPWDYWGQKFTQKNLKNRGIHHSQMQTHKQQAIKNSSQLNYIESEDRIKCKTPNFRDILKYITRIDIFYKKYYCSTHEKNNIIYLCQLAQEKDILDKVFIYTKINEFNSQTSKCLSGEQFYKKYVLLDENIEYEVKPSEIDVSSFERQNELQPEIWKNNQLNPQLRLKLLDIADDFYNSLEISWVKPIDIILTGSICNFNWSKYSDIDLHIVIDYREVSEQTDFVKTFLDAKKNQWNEQHDTLEMFGFPVELYVQDISEDAVSSGVYSLEKDEWLKEPNFNEMSMEDIDRSDLKEKAASIMTYIDDIEERFNSTEDKHQLEELNNELDHLTKKLKQIRTSYLDKDGEISLGNLVYKILRRTEYLDKIWNISDKIYDKINSIN